MSEVLELGAASVEEVVDVFCDAFRDYPVMRSVLGELGDAYAVALRTLVSLFVHARVLRHEFLFGIGRPDALQAAAIVSRPLGPLSPPELGELRERVWRQLGTEARVRYDAFSAVWATFRVDEPHLHLNMIGVRRSLHGKGLARTLLERVHELSRRDPRSVGVSLTTEDPDNVPFYEYFGYRVVGHAQLNPAVQTWGLFRPDPIGRPDASPGRAES